MALKYDVNIYKCSLMMLEMKRGMIVNWMNVESVEELKQCGKVAQIRSQIKVVLGPKPPITGRGYTDLFERIVEFREVLKQFNLPVDEQGEYIMNDDVFFISKTHAYIFYLTELGEVDQKRLLKIEEKLFRNQREAMHWYNQIAILIHPRVCTHPKAMDASLKLKAWYDKMVEPKELS